MIVRISKASFPPAATAEVERALRIEEPLRSALARLPGLLAYYVGIDRETAHMTNTSVWTDVQHASQMSTLPEMLALRETFLGLGCEFDPITNHDVLWELAPR